MSPSLNILAMEPKSEYSISYKVLSEFYVYRKEEKETEREEKKNEGKRRRERNK